MKNKRNSGIYHIINKINGNCYVGQSIDLNNRWKGHLSSYKNKKGNHPILHLAFDKYGLKNFEYVILCECPKEYLNKMEIHMINSFDSYRNGYNADPGGKGGTVGTEVHQYTLEGEFIETFSSSATTEVCDPSSILKVIKGQRYHAGGYLWVHDKKDLKNTIRKYQESRIKLREVAKSNGSKTTKRQVQRIDSEGNVKIYESLSQACRDMNVTKNAIRSVILNKRKTCKGYNWRY